MFNTIIRPALVLLALLSAFTGLLYPAAVTGAVQALFPWQSQGSLLERDGRTIGSALIGQPFAEPRNFWGRPSATASMPNNGAASGGSNQGPLNPALTEAVQARVQALREADPGNDAPVPADLVTTSASGLDPHITPAAARYQAARVARLRGLPKADVLALIDRHTEAPLWGLIGEPRVNVLALNLALAAAGSSARPAP